jgi:bacteriocin biosynthesis cyclodehydratase domain-containing protein
MFINETLDIFRDGDGAVYQARNKEAVMTIAFDKPEDEAVFNGIVTQLQAGKGSITADALIDRMSKAFPRETVVRVVRDLRDNGILTDSVLRRALKGALGPQMQFWNRAEFGTQGLSPQQLQDEWTETRLAIVGDQYLAELIAQKAKLTGLGKVTTVVRPERSLTPGQLDHLMSSDVIVAAYDQHHAFQLNQINKEAIRLGKAWLLVRGMNGMTASVGPLFVGKETGCFHCLTSRLKSTMDHADLYDSYESYLLEHQAASRGEGAPIAAYDLIANLAVLEVMKLRTKWAVPATYGNIINFDLYDVQTTTHPFLRTPVCPVCKPVATYSPAPWLEPLIQLPA